MFSAPQPGDFAALLRSLAHPTTLIEIAVLIGCIALAWFSVRLLAGHLRGRRSIWVGERLVDGVLFPVLALGYALAARWLLHTLLTIAAFKLAIPLLVALVVIRVTVRVLEVAFPASPIVRAIERTLSWFVWLALVLWLTGLLPLLLDPLDDIHWQMGGTQITLRNLLEGIASAGMVLVAVLWLSAAIEDRLLRGEHASMSLRKIAANAVRALLFFVGLLLALSAAGIPLTALSVFSGAVGVGIGFGLQKLAANYVSGFVILAERSLNIGDLVRVDNFEGRIVDITTRYTVIRATNGGLAYVPNEMLITQRVENYTRADPIRALTTTFRVPYGTDLDALRPKLLSAVRAVPRVVATPEPALLLSALPAEGMQLTLEFSIDDAERGTENVTSDVNLAVLHSIDGLGLYAHAATKK